MTNSVVCDKRAFCNKHEAKAMLRSAKERNVEHRAECRIYRCDSCRCWHLTSMSLGEYEAKKAIEDLTNPN